MSYNNTLYVVGIDPDCEKSGVVLLNTQSRKIINICNKTFPELIDYLQTCRDFWKDEISGVVVVEAGWLNQSNWHLGKFDSKAIAASKGNAVGRNHETGRKIIEMCRHYGLEVIEQKPLKKIWGGPDGKITHAEISYFIETFPTRSNQETRDAALLAWHHAGLPIRINANSVKNLSQIFKK